MLRGLAAAIDGQLRQCVARGARWLDFGCGSMPYRAIVEALGADYAGADFDAAAPVRIAADGTLPIPDGSLDAVLSVQVLEHVRDLDAYLAEAARVLRPGGTLLLSTHGTWLYHPHPEDHRRWTRSGLVVDLESRGFQVLMTCSIVGPLATSTMIRLTGYCFFLRRLPAIGRPAAGLLSIVMNLRGWIEDRLTPVTIREHNGCIYLARCIRVPE